MDVVIVPFQMPPRRELLLAQVALKLHSRVRGLHVGLEALAGVEHVVADPTVEPLLQVAAGYMTPEMPAAVEVLVALSSMVSFLILRHLC